MKYRPDGLPGPVWWTPIEVMNDGGYARDVEISGNEFNQNSFAIHGYWGANHIGNPVVVKDNTIIGTEQRKNKVILQDDGNHGNIKADIQNNTLTNGLIGLVNLVEDGETVSDPPYIQRFRLV